MDRFSTGSSKGGKGGRLSLLFDRSAPWLLTSPPTRHLSPHPFICLPHAHSHRGGDSIENSLGGGTRIVLHLRTATGCDRAFKLQQDSNSFRLPHFLCITLYSTYVRVTSTPFSRSSWSWSCSPCLAADFGQSMSGYRHALLGSHVETGGGGGRVDCFTVSTSRKG